MMKELLLLTFGLIFFQFDSAFGQMEVNAYSSDSEYSVENAAKFPHLKIGAETAGKLKIASRKLRFSLDEILILDVAILNITNSPQYFTFPSLDRIKVYRDNSPENLVKRYSIYDFVPKFILIGPHQMRAMHWNIVLGCSEGIFRLNENRRKAKSNVELFEDNLFLFVGDACADVKPEDVIRIDLDVENNYVAFTGIDKDNPKTAIGKLTSNSLTVAIRR